MARWWTTAWGTVSYEDMRPTDSKAGVEHRLQPDGEIEVIERATSNEAGGEQEWMIQLQWQTATDKSKNRPDSADDRPEISTFILDYQPFDPHAYELIVVETLRYSYR